MKKILFLLVLALLSSLGCNKETAQKPGQHVTVVADKNGGADQKQVKMTDENEKKPAPPQVKTAKEDGPLYKGRPAISWIKQLQDKDVSFRLEAVKALAALATDDKLVLPDLISVLKDMDSQVRAAGEKALDALSLAGDLPLLARVLETEQDKNTRLIVIALIGKVGPTATPLLPLLQKSAIAQDQDVALAAKQAIELIRIFDPTEEQIQVAVKAVEKIGGRYLHVNNEWYLEHEDLRTKKPCHVFLINNADNLKMLPFIPFVFELDLRFSQATDLEIKGITKQRNLTGLNLNDLRSGSIGDAALEAIKDMKRLSVLHLHATQVGDAGLKHLKELKTIKVLTLGNTKVTDEGLQNLRSLQNIIFLDLNSTRITDAGLRELKHHPNLATLRLNNTQVTDAGLIELRHLANLTALDLNDTRVSDSGLKEIAALRKLSSLNLSKTHITDAGLKKLRALTTLTRLDLWDTKLTDAGMKEIKELKNLTSLTLFRTKVTDSGVMELMALKNLTSLMLDNTQVTEAGVSDLRKALPSCSISYRKTTGQ